MGSTGHTETNAVLPHPDNEATRDSNIKIYGIHPIDKINHGNQPRPGNEAPDEESLRVNEVQPTNESKDNIHKTKEPHPDEEAELDFKSHYDTGWAWVVCGTTFLMEFFVGGLITSSGVIYAALIDEFNKSRAETGEKICQPSKFAHSIYSIE